VVEVEYEYFCFLTVPDAGLEAESFGGVDEDVADTFAGDDDEELGERYRFCRTGKWKQISSAESSGNSFVSMRFVLA
jgi:hypothetical protein